MTSVTSTSYSPSKDVDCDWAQVHNVVGEDPPILAITTDYFNPAIAGTTMREVDIVAYPVNS